MSQTARGVLELVKENKAEAQGLSNDTSQGPPLPLPSWQALGAPLHLVQSVICHPQHISLVFIAFIFPLFFLPGWQIPPCCPSSTLQFLAPGLYPSYSLLGWHCYEITILVVNSWSPTSKASFYPFFYQYPCILTRHSLFLLPLQILLSPVSISTHPTTASALTTLFLTLLHSSPRYAFQTYSSLAST